jgi:antitoxin component of MazEF toxin-antitoxin module
MPFIKKLSRVGDSTCVILDKQLLKMADIEPDSEVEIRVENGTIVVAPHRHATDEEFRRAKTSLFAQNRRALKRLAE